MEWLSSKFADAYFFFDLSKQPDDLPPEKVEEIPLENSPPVDKPSESKFIQPVGSFSVAVPLGESWRREVSVDNERKLPVFTHFREPDEIDLPEVDLPDAKPLESTPPPKPSAPSKVDPPLESIVPLLNHCPEPPSPPSTSLCPRPVFGTNAEYELDLLKTAYNSAVQVDQQTGRIKFGSVQLVNETINRLNWLMDAAEDNTELSLVYYHLFTLKTILLTCKTDYLASLPSQYGSLHYPLLQSSIISFCADMEMYSEYSGSEIRPRDMHQLGVHKTITERRNLVAHNTLNCPAQVDLTQSLMNCLVWYSKYFWPNLSISRNCTTSGAQFLNYQFHFPGVKINNQKISGELKITDDYVQDFDAFSDSKEVESDGDYDAEVYLFFDLSKQPDDLPPEEEEEVEVSSEDTSLEEITIENTPLFPSPPSPPHSLLLHPLVDTFESESMVTCSSRKLSTVDTWRPSFGTDAESELTQLKNAFNATIQVNHREQRITFGSVPLINDDEWFNGISFQ